MKLRLMPDYDCHPLWDVRVDGVRNIAVDELAISPQLKRELSAWADRYDKTLDRDDPASSGFPSDQAELEFDQEGRHLWELLRKELGADVEVTYFSQIENCEIVQ